jgi:hypothetical protein
VIDYDKVQTLIDALTADNPDSVKLPADVVKRLDRFKQEHPDLVLDPTKEDGTTADSVKREELAALETEFEAAGGRGVELADQIDALRAEVAIEQAVAGMPQHPRIERSGPTDAPWWVYIPPRGPQDFDTDDWSILGPYGGTYWPFLDEAVAFMQRTLDSATCKHCGRSITRENGAWVDPEATGDDAVWRETCDLQDTFTAEHEPDNDGYADMARRALAAGLTEAERAAADALADRINPTVQAFNRLLDALDAARVDTDEPDGEQRYQDAREACFAFVDAHPEVLPLARDYGLPISPGELPTKET